MFRIYINNQDKKYPLYEPLDSNLRVFEPVLTQEIGTAGSFQFSITAQHPYADKIGLLRTEIIVYEDEVEIFRGRILKPEYSIQNIITILCEGDLTYLLDSQQQPRELKTDIPNFIRKILEIHNSQVDEFKKIQLGNVTVTDKNSNILRKIAKYSTTREVLEEHITSVYGGYFRIRNMEGVKYLDYLWDYGGINSQVIRFGENMLDLNKYMDATNIITCLIPFGGEVEYTNALGEKQTKTIDITTENNGVNYIQNDLAIKEYGKIWGVNTWKEVVEPRELFKKAKDYLKEVSALPITMEVNAVDLSLINKDVQQFNLGYWTHVSSEPHKIEKKFMLTKRVINLLDPTSGSITLGRAIKTLTENNTKNQADALKAIKKTEEKTTLEIKRKIENATNLITGGLGGYVVLDNVDPETGENVHPWRILIMNTPEKDTAKNVIQLNQNGIGFSTNGINGPYTNAWTIDGNLVADFITTGTMLADRIRGGIMEVGGKGLGKNGSIVVKDTTDKVAATFNTSGIVINNGSINAPDIKGGTAEFGNGLFYADNDYVQFGGFEARYGWGRDIFQSSDQKTGMSAAANKAGKFWIWAGFNNSYDYDFAVNNSGTCLARDFKCIGGQGFWKNWTITETMQDIYSRLEDIQRRIN